MQIDLTSLKNRLGEYLHSQGIENINSFCCVHPDHEDKHPSAHVYITKQGEQRFKCHSCGVSGDIFDVASWLEGLPDAKSGSWYKDNVRVIGNRFGIHMPPAITSPTLEIYRRILDVCEEYVGDDVYGGIDTGKGFPVQAKLTLPLEDLIAYLREAGFSLSEISAASLDELRFSPDYIMIPLYSSPGVIVGYAAKRFDVKPKYMTTPNNAVFDKSLYLYGLFFNYSGDNPLYVVEGQRDVLGLVSAEYDAVSPMGTRLTSEQVQLIKKRGFRNIILCPDGDEAGRKGITRNIEALLFESIIPQVCLLPEGTDPLDHAEKGQELPEATDGLRYYYHALVKENGPEDGLKLVLRTIAQIRSAVIRDKIILQLANITGIRHQSLLHDTDDIVRKIEQKQETRIIDLTNKLAETVRKSPDNVIGLTHVFKDQMTDLVADQRISAVDRAVSMLSSVQSASYDLPDKDLSFRPDGLGRVTDLLHENGLGYTEGKLLLIAGDEHTGKTTFTTQAAVEFLLASPDSVVIYHSTDDSIEELIPRFVSSLVFKPEFSLFDAVSGKFDNPAKALKAKETIKKVMDWLYTGRLVLIDRTETGKLANVIPRIARVRERFPEARIMLVNDNFHRDSDFSELGDDNAKMEHLAALAKNIAVEYQLSVWATVEYRKQKDSLWARGNDDIAGSRALKYAGNVIIHLFNDVASHQGVLDRCIYTTTDHGRVIPILQMTIGKNKVSGKLGRFYFAMYPHCGFFKDIDQDATGRMIAERIKDEMQRRKGLKNE